jgi:hypothetical protein
MLKHALAIFVATTIPALAADNLVSRHEVRFDHVSFVCEKKDESGKLVRYAAAGSLGSAGCNATLMM